MRLYHGFRKFQEHTVVQGTITSIENCGNAYYVEFYKARSKHFGGDFDDMGSRKITDQYHYNQACKKV